ncbi:MAG TPA: ABC transporter ATP-binding protein [Pseudothermotoga sp.]|uniref:ABC transporter ATP-binding protein n=1 Tax=Thermotoga profunda TaxID=1508420 RepID=UPI00059780FD|nr:ABC transporter ATP-binding protein [Thermotoga profunda]
MTEYYVEVRNLTKEFKDPSTGSFIKAVNDVSFGVKKGQLMTLLGPSGCGKTTTLRLIGGFEIATKGDVLIDGSIVNDQPPNKRPTAMVFQSYALFPHMNVFENVAYGLKNRKLTSQEIKNRVSQILHIVGLSGLEKRYPSQLSGGQQQRVALARALVIQPKVLLLDEPLSNLDAKLREQMRIELKKIQSSLGITSIYVTHDQLEAMTLSDVITVMKDGIIMQQDPPQMIYRYPVNKFVAGFIGKANFLEAVVVQCTENKCKIRTMNNVQIEVHVREGIQYEVNEKVYLVLRPEGGRFVKPKEGIIDGVVITRVYTGASAFFEVKTDYGILSIEIQNPSSLKLPEQNEIVGLDFDQNTLSVVRYE